MAFISSGVEYGLHCALYLVRQADTGQSPSARDLAELQGIPAEFAAKVFTKLQKAGIVTTCEGVMGGIQLGREPADISVQDVVIAIDGERPLFQCREIRERCAVFAGNPPNWATDGLCGIHAAMLQAERAMRDSLSSVSLADLSQGVEGKAPEQYFTDIDQWLDERIKYRTSPRKGKTK